MTVCQAAGCARLQLISDRHRDPTGQVGESSLSRLGSWHLLKFPHLFTVAQLVSDGGSPPVPSFPAQTPQLCRWHTLIVTLRRGVAERCPLALDDWHGLLWEPDEGPFPGQGSEGQDFCLLCPVRSPTRPASRGDSRRASPPSCCSL